MSLPDSLVPPNESQRLEALAPYLVLGNAPDAVFDELVRLTAKLFNVPIALVSLVEEGSVWFKANFGLAGAERVARNESMCSVKGTASHFQVIDQGQGRIALESAGGQESDGGWSPW